MADNSNQTARPTYKKNYIWNKVTLPSGRTAYQNLRSGLILSVSQWNDLVKTRDPKALGENVKMTPQEFKEFQDLPADVLSKMTKTNAPFFSFPPVFERERAEMYAHSGTTTQAQKKPATPQSRVAPQNKAASRLAGQKAFTEAVSESAKAMQSGAPSATDANVVPNTPSGRPDYKYYADMLNAADSNDSYYRDFLNLRNQARAAAREAAASNMRYQFVPIRDDRANRIYFVNADGSDVVLDMGKPEDVREYRRVAEKIGVDINHLSDWMDRSSKPLARYNMPPGSNVDTTPDFGFWRKLPSTKAEGAAPTMDIPSAPTDLGLSLSERKLPRVGKMPSPQSTLETIQRMRDLRMPIEGFPAAQTPEPATPAAPAPSAPVAQTKQAEPAKSAEEQGTKMQQPAVAAVAPQSQQFTPRAASMPTPVEQTANQTQPVKDFFEQMQDQLKYKDDPHEKSNRKLNVAQEKQSNAKQPAIAAAAPQSQMPVPETATVESYPLNMSFNKKPLDTTRDFSRGLLEAQRFKRMGQLQFTPEAMLASAPGQSQSVVVGQRNVAPLFPQETEEERIKRLLENQPEFFKRDSY